MFRFCAAAAVMFTVCAMATPAAAQFVQVPSAEDFAREYPPEALAAELSGQVEIECRVNSDGELGRCRVNSETPAGHGFGEAGLRMAQYFRATEPPHTVGRTQSRPSVTIPLIFEATSSSNPSQQPSQTPATPPATEQRPSIRDTEGAGTDM